MQSPKFNASLGKVINERSNNENSNPEYNLSSPTCRNHEPYPPYPITKQPCTGDFSHTFKGITYDYANLLGLGEAYSVVTQIINRVPSSQESITQDGEGSYRLRKVHSHDSADASALHLKNIVIGTNCKLVTGEGEGKIGKRVAFRAFNSKLSVPSLLGTNLLI